MDARMWPRCPLVGRGNDVVSGAVSTTKCLAWHVARAKALREIIRETCGRLREEGVLNSH